MAAYLKGLTAADVSPASLNCAILPQFTVLVYMIVPGLHIINGMKSIVGRGVLGCSLHRVPKVVCPVVAEAAFTVFSDVHSKAAFIQKTLRLLQSRCINTREVGNILNGSPFPPGPSTNIMRTLVLYIGKCYYCFGQVLII